MSGRKINIWIISDIFYPNEKSTGYILTKLALGLGHKYNVSVLTKGDKKNYTSKYEKIINITIFRIKPIISNYHNLFLRIIDSLYFCLGIMRTSLKNINVGDLLFCVTNPPFLGHFVSIIASIKKAKVAIIVHDVYPDLLSAIGLITKNSLLFKIWTFLNKVLYKKAKLIIAISEDMKKLITNRFYSNGLEKKVKVIPNWAELEIVKYVNKRDSIAVKEYNLSNKFIVNYSGNFGRPNDMETIIKAAERLKEVDEIIFLFGGDGIKKKNLETEVKKLGLKNIIFLGRYTRIQQTEVLAASDISIISLVKNMKGISFPSRFYNVLAAGRPIIAIVERESELAELIRKENLGWVVEPGDYNDLVKKIHIAMNDNYIEEKGKKARFLAENCYRYEYILSLYQEEIGKIISG